MENFSTVRTIPQTISSADIEQRWHLFKKVTFRFLFVFFALEITTPDFQSLMFLAFRSNILQEISTPPFLWLNENIFHFYYNPWESWTFTFTLLLVRLITFLVITLVVCIIWSVLDSKRANYNKLDFWLRTVLWVYLSGVMWAYAIIKIFPVQMAMPDFIDLQLPMGDASPFQLYWATMGYGTPYEIFAGVVEGIGAVLLLFRRTRLAGLLIILGILCNVVVVNYTYTIGVIAISSFLLLMNIYLLTPYLRSVWIFFFTDKAVSQQKDMIHYRFTTRWKKLAVFGLGAITLVASYTSSFYRAHSRYITRSAINQSKKFYEVKNFIVNEDTLKDLVVGDSIRWRFWSERVADNTATVTLHTMNRDVSKSYTITRDSIKHQLKLKPSGGSDTTSTILFYRDLDSANFHVQGMIAGKRVSADLQKFDPATSLRLLSTKRQVFMIDWDW